MKLLPRTRVAHAQLTPIDPCVLCRGELLVPLFRQFQNAISTIPKLQGDIFVIGACALDLLLGGALL